MRTIVDTTGKILQQGDGKDGLRIVSQEGQPIVDIQEQATRTESVVALHVYDRDGRLVLRDKQAEGGAVKYSFSLPGVIEMVHFFS